MLLTGGSSQLLKGGGIIKLIPKKDAEPSLIRNWRLITLLNCDHNIVAKALVNHVKTFLPKWKVETGFMKYWIIGENIRLIDGIIYYTVDEKLPWLLLFLDFQKAFDTVEWSYIKKKTHLECLALVRQLSTEWKSATTISKTASWIAVDLLILF